MKTKQTEKEIAIKIEGSEWEAALDRAFQEENKKVKIDGFRKGKAPKHIFIKQFGEERLYLAAADQCVEVAYDQMLEDQKDLELVAQPQVNIKSVDGSGVEFVFGLTLKPEVKLGAYKGLKVKKEKVVVTKEEIKETIDQMRQRFAEEVTKEDGSVEDGDTAIIDFEGFKDDVAFDGGKGENYSLKIGSGSFIPGFEEQVIGMKVGEVKEIHLSFPKDYHSEELKGQPVVFKVTVHEIKTEVIPKIGEDFFEDLGMEGVDSVEALEKEVKETIKARKEVDLENKYIDDLLAAAAHDIQLEIPVAMLDDELHRMIHQYEDNLKMQGVSLDLFYQITHSDEAALKEQMTEEAKKRITYRLMLEEIAKVEKIEISDEKALEEANKLATKYQMEQEEFLESFGGTDMIKYDLKMREAIELLKGEEK